MVKSSLVELWWHKCQKPKKSKEGEATPIIAHTEKKGFVDHTQAQLAKLLKSLNRNR